MATPNGKGGWELSDDDINEMRAAGMIDDTPSELQQYGIVYAQGLARLRKKDGGGYVLASEAAEHEATAVAAAREDERQQCMRQWSPADNGLADAEKKYAQIIALSSAFTFDEAMAMFAAINPKGDGLATVAAAEERGYNNGVHDVYQDNFVFTTASWDIEHTRIMQVERERIRVGVERARVWAELHHGSDNDPSITRCIAQKDVFAIIDGA
jgi:hypothetical protein